MSLQHFERSHLTGFRCELSQHELSQYLQKVQRPLRSILNKRNLHDMGDGHFIYNASPLRVLSFTLTPSVQLKASWNQHALTIIFEHCRLDGLGEWQDHVTFQCRATLTPSQGQLMAHATAGLQIDVKGRAELIPAILIRQASFIALDSTLNRLGQRVRIRMQKDVHRWNQKAHSRAEWLSTPNG